MILKTGPLGWKFSSLITKPLFQLGTNIYVKGITTTVIRIWTIALLLANCEVNSDYCDCKVVNHPKQEKQFFSQRKFNSSALYSSTLHPNYILILYIHCVLLSKEIKT